MMLQLFVTSFFVLGPTRSRHPFSPFQGGQEGRESDGVSRWPAGGIWQRKSLSRFVKLPASLHPLPSGQSTRIVDWTPFALDEHAKMAWKICIGTEEAARLCDSATRSETAMILEGQCDADKQNMQRRYIGDNDELEPGKCQATTMRREGNKK
ncbi:hypothetical protein BCV70DRAFT_70866 [Testicularia cyperi]|uniref:Uncharacterized protein n=1 Tax=Testicularia cyperi TaxID=1882483 RepID=A0A317XHA3_9BASI|nr:hypothetical protein BCV70DRAFT_70866 [Testicularia cyperi]